MVDSNSREMWQAVRRKLRYISLYEFDHNIHISLKNKFLYVETPKVACSTLKLTLARLELEDNEYFREDIHDRNVSPLLRPVQAGDFERLTNDQGFIKFCFVRNPYERLLSSYLNKVKRRDKRIYPTLLCQLGLDQTDFNQEISFDLFVTSIEQVPISMMNSHWRPQYYQTFQDSLKFDYVGRLENFEKDILRIGDMISKDVAPFLQSWTTHQTNSRDKLKDYYTPELQERVYELYKIDFEKFDYPRELSPQDKPR